MKVSRNESLSKNSHSNNNVIVSVVATPQTSISSKTSSRIAETECAPAARDSDSCAEKEQPCIEKDTVDAPRKDCLPWETPAKEGCPPEVSRTDSPKRQRPAMSECLLRSEQPPTQVAANGSSTMKPNRLFLTARPTKGDQAKPDGDADQAAVGSASKGMKRERLLLTKRVTPVKRKRLEESFTASDNTDSTDEDDDLSFQENDAIFGKWEMPDPKRPNLLARKYKNVIEVKFRNGQVDLTEEMLTKAKKAAEQYNTKSNNIKVLAVVIANFFNECHNNLFSSIKKKSIVYPGKKLLKECLLLFICS